MLANGKSFLRANLGEEARLSTRLDKINLLIERCVNDLEKYTTEANGINTELSGAEERSNEIRLELDGLITALRDAKADRHENQRVRKLNEAIDAMKRLIPGVHGTPFVAPIISIVFHMLYLSFHVSSISWGVSHFHSVFLFTLYIT